MTSPRARCLVVDLGAPPPAVDWEAAPLWRIIATTDGVPCGAAWVVSPGRLLDPEAFLEQTLVDAREWAAELALGERIAAQLGIETPAPPPQTVSVVVCTHRRSHFLPGLLSSLAALSPAPAEVVIVDNDPGDEDCRALVESHGARYVREDRRGLNHARSAGLAAVTGSIVAYTDDDCVLPTGWLARVERNFADPVVDAVTGPAFAFELESPAQLRFELAGGFNRGLAERQFDWMTIAPPLSGAVGAGANMMFRRHRLLELGEPFPPELDAGTIAQTGGDLWVLYRVLDGGGRVVYDPGSYVFHRHRHDVDALERTFLGYGTGIVAAVSKLLVERHEPEAILLLRWLWQQYREALKWRLAGQLDPRSLRVSALYLRGGIGGMFSWPRSLAAERQVAGRHPALIADHPPPESSQATAPLPGATPRASSPSAGPTVSVIIPTVGRPGVLARCLAALPAASTAHQIIVVDDRSAGASGPLLGHPQPGVEMIRSGGVGAAAARNAGARAARGEVLLFLDDDLIAGEGLVDRHRAVHAQLRDVFVIGHSLPAPPGAGWAARAAALWWHDHFRTLASRRRLAATDMLSGNVSIRRDRFLDLGGFAERLGRLRREDWLFGAAVLRAGMAVRYEPQALARHEFTLSTGARMRAAIEEGWGDALLASAEPAFLPALPAAPSGRTAVRITVLGSILARRRPRALAVGVLDRLESLRMRSQWLGLFNYLQQMFYLHGRRRGAAQLAVGDRSPCRPVLALDPDGQPCTFDGPLAPDLLVAANGSETVIASDVGRWTITQARAAARTVAAAGELRPAPRPVRLPGLRVVLVAREEDVGPAVRGGAAAADVQLCLVAGGASPWAEVERLVGARHADVIWVALENTLLQECIAAELRSLSDGDRVAATLVVPGQNAVRYLFDGALDSSEWLLLAEPPAIVGIRADALERLGGVRSWLEAVGGPTAPALELLRRALHQGEVLGQGTATGIRRRRHVRRPWRNHEWRRQRAYGALLAIEPLPLATIHLLRAVATIAVLGVSGSRSRRRQMTALAGLAHGVISARSARSRGDP